MVSRVVYELINDGCWSFKVISTVGRDRLENASNGPELRDMTEATMSSLTGIDIGCCRDV